MERKSLRYRIVIAMTEESSELPKEVQGEIKHAIVVGIDEYEAKTRIPTLDGAENDAAELQKSLTSPALGFTVAMAITCWVKRQHIKLSTKLLVSSFRKNTNDPADVILFYFSGHGYVNEETNLGYIIPYDMDPDDPEYCGKRMDYLRNTDIFIQK